MLKRFRSQDGYVARNVKKKIKFTGIINSMKMRVLMMKRRCLY